MWPTVCSFATWRRHCIPGERHAFTGNAGGDAFLPSKFVSCLSPAKPNIALAAVQSWLKMSQFQLLVPGPVQCQSFKVQDHISVEWVVEDFTCDISEVQLPQMVQSLTGWCSWTLYPPGTYTSALAGWRQQQPGPVDCAARLKCDATQPIHATWHGLARQLESTRCGPGEGVGGGGGGRTSGVTSALWWGGERAAGRRDEPGCGSRGGSQAGWRWCGAGAWASALIRAWPPIVSSSKYTQAFFSTQCTDDNYYDIGIRTLLYNQNTDTSGETFAMPENHLV